MLFFLWLLYPAFSISLPLNKIWPFPGLSKPANRESNVDLPEPDFPIIA